MPISFSEYQALAQRTEKRLTGMQRILHHVLGIMSEAGEIADPVKKEFIYGKQFSPAHLREEIGDLLWYVANLCTALNIDMHDAAADNIAKLRKRYPEQYTDTAALARADKQPIWCPDIKREAEQHAGMCLSCGNPATVVSGHHLLSLPPECE